MSRRRLVNRTLLYLALAAFAVIYIYPFLLDIGTAFKTESDAAAHHKFRIHFVCEAGSRCKIVLLRLNQCLPVFVG